MDPIAAELDALTARIAALPAPALRELLDRIDRALHPHLPSYREWLAGAEAEMRALAELDAKSNPSASRAA